MSFRLLNLGALLLAITTPLALADEEDGLFADFETNLGNFTVQLEFEKVPRTVANFVGLAEGSRPWIDAGSRNSNDPNDLGTGTVHENTPFYDGLIFHRVIDGFMIQGGSRNGFGTDGPGYTFVDEFDPELRHDGPYVLSMANAGPNTNGSQFFITVAPTPHLDDGHSVFGLVVDGQNVVDGIGLVDTDANDRPLEPVVMETVSIRRVGAAAEAFDVNAWQLPEPRATTDELLVIPNQLVESQAELGPGEVVMVWGTANFNGWQYFGQLYQPVNTQPFTGINFDNASTQRAFYHVPIVRYPDAMGPADFRNTSFTFEFNDTVITQTVSSNGVDGVAVVDQGGEGDPVTVDSDVVDYLSEPHRIQIIFVAEEPDAPFYGLYYTMNLDSIDGNGVATGRLRVDRFTNQWVFLGNGTFTMELPPPP